MSEKRQWRSCLKCPEQMPSHTRPRMLWNEEWGIKTHAGQMDTFRGAWRVHSDVEWVFYQIFVTWSQTSCYCWIPKFRLSKKCSYAHNYSFIFVACFFSPRIQGKSQLALQLCSQLRLSKYGKLNWKAIPRAGILNLFAECVTSVLCIKQLHWCSTFTRLLNFRVYFSIPSYRSEKNGALVICNW